MTSVTVKNYGGYGSGQKPYTYSKTRTPNLVRYDRTKEYYLLYKLNGKQVRTPLKTSDYKVAVRRRNAKMLEVEKLRSVAPKNAVSKETFGSLFDEYKKKTGLDQDISCSTKEGRAYEIKRIVKTLPGIGGKKPMNLEIGEVMLSDLLLEIIPEKCPQAAFVLVSPSPADNVIFWIVLPDGVNWIEFL